MNKTMMGAIMDPVPQAAAPAPAPAAVPAKAAQQPVRTMLGGGFEGIADLVKAVETGAPLPPPPETASPPASLPAAAAAPFVPPVVAPAAPFVPPAASSTAGLARSPLSGGTTPAIAAAAAGAAAWGAQTIDQRGAPAPNPAPTPATAIPRREAMKTMLGAALDEPPQSALPQVPTASAASSPVAPSAVAPSQLAPSAAAPSQVALPQVAPSPVAPSPVAPAQVAPLAADAALDPSPPTAALDEPTMRDGNGLRAVAPAGSTIEGMPAAPRVDAAVPATPRTLEGVAPPAVAPAAAAPTPAAPPERHARARTMLGMAAPVIGALPQSQPVEPAAPIEPAPPIEPARPIEPAPPIEPASPSTVVAAPAPEAPAALPKRALGPSNRTMLGVAAPARAAIQGAIDASRATSETVPVAPAPLPPQVALPTSSSSTSTGELSIAGLPSPRRRARGAFFALLFVGVMLVGSVIVAALYYRMTRARTDVVASVGSSAAGEVLHVGVTDAPDGTHVRFAGQDLALGPTGTDFPLAAEALHVGDNAISVDVVFPDGTSETHQVTLTVEYRIRADLASLTATPPAITVVIDAVPGSTVTLDAQPFPLDAAGHGTRACPVDSLTPAADGAIEHVAHYVITPPAPSVPATGALTTRVPVVTVHVDRPADGAVTDRTSLDIAGAVSPGATVTVGGAPASVTAEGRFTATIPLAAIGEQEIQIAASAPGRVAAARTLHVRRVADLAREAASFTVDRSLTYARIAAAPTTFQGQHVAIEGRVYNVDLQDGHGVLQLLARDCPSGERCPLWVTYSAATEVTVESWVRVVGSVVGEQQFRSQAGEVRTVPHVDATFVLPARP